MTAVVAPLAFLHGPGGPESSVYVASHDLGWRVHETLGLTVFVLAIVRVILRFGATPPMLPAGFRSMDMAARSVQLAICILFSRGP